MTTDFKATQVQTNKIIVTGSFAGDGSNQLLIYNYAADDSGSPNQGQIDPSKFDTSSGIGSDVFLFVSGGVSTRSTGGSYGVTVMGGDLHISGNLTVDGTYPSGGGGGGGDVFWTSPVSDVVETTGSIRMDTNTTAGTYAVAVGTNTSASGNSSFAQGDSTVASGRYSHAEGSGSLASNDAAHAEGILTTASEEGSHAEGFSTTASGYAAHAEGRQTLSSGNYSHAEGNDTTALGSYSHAEGTNTTASGEGSHSEGNDTISQNLYTHAEGNNTVAGPEFLGYSVTAVDEISQAPNGIFQLAGSYVDQTPTIGNPTFVIGRNGGSFLFVTSSYDGFNTYITCSSGAPFSYSYTGVDVITLWAYFGSSAPGGANVVFGTSAHSEGDSTYSFGNAAHSEGQTTVAVGDYSHSEGSSAFAIGEASHAEGYSSAAVGNASHAEGDSTIARGYASHTEGLGTIASGSYQHVQGKYNLRNNDFSLFVIGDGTADDDASRSDILRVNSGTLPGLGSFEVTGTVLSTLGFSGSLTRLTDGRSYLVAGTNILITTSSDGQVTINSSGVGGGTNYWLERSLDLIYSTGSVEITGSFTQGEGGNIAGYVAHAQGRTTKAMSDYSHAEGWNTEAGTGISGEYSHAEGAGSRAYGFGSHAEGDYTYASGQSSHTEGWLTTASYYYSHAEGERTLAEGWAAHSEGLRTYARGYYSHAEGSGSVAFGEASHSEGVYTIASGSGQLAAGKYNLRNNDFSLFVIGDGTADDDASRSDIVRVNSGTLPGSGSFEVTGTVRSTLGFSGSLTQLTDGRSYLVAGTNVTITSASDGQVTISSTGGGGGDQFWQSNTLNSIFTTGSVLITGSLHTSSSITGSNLVLEAQASRILAPNGALVISSSAGTFLTGTFIVSGTRSNLGTEQSSILFNGDLFVSGGIGVNDYLQLKPVNTLLIPTNTTASYIYVSGSTNDLYFTQYSDPYTNTTRLRWLESTLSSGLLHGGILSTQNGTTTFSITSGSGLVVSYNASTTTDPYPTIKFVGWPAYVSQSLTYSGSAQISYIGINDSGGIIQRTTPFDAIDYETYIPIGRILHQSGSVTNGTITSPHVSYGVPGSHDVFVRAFGPLKLSGHILAASGSTLSLTKTGGDSYVEGRNYTSNPSSPDLVLSTTDFALTGSKIYREHVSGSNPVIDTGVGAAGYTDIDPTKYVDANGNLQTVSGGQYTVQRVFWFPNSVNRALFVYYGPTSYNSIASAQSGIADEVFIEGANTAGAAIFVGYVIVRSNASDLTDTAQAKIIQGPLFRAAGSGGGGGGGGTTTAGGSDTYVQFNDGGSTFGGVAGLTFNKVTNTLTTTNLAVSNIATVSGSVILGDSPSDVVTVSGSLRALSGIQVTGSIAATLGFSGSLTHLTDGTSYLIAGTNVQISTGSTGAVTISSIPNNVVRDRTTATNFTIDTATDQFIRVSAAATGTLPNPATSGSFVIKKTGTGTYTINVSGSYGETIDGQTYDATGFTLSGSFATDRPAWTMWSDGTNWWIA